MNFRRWHDRYIWTWIAIAVLMIGTAIVLIRQQANFDEHNDLADNTCAVVRNNIDVIRLFVTTENDSHHRDETTVGDELQAAVDKSERLVRQLDCNS